MPISYHDFGGKGPTIHFNHANAYPPESYLSLIKPFTKDYNVIGMHQRPLWPNSNPKKLKEWRDLADDLITFLDQQKLRNIIGMGHSLGAVVSVFAAKKRPDLFSKLILIEPVTFPKFIKIVNLFSPIWLKRKTIPVAKQAMRRTDRWASKQEVFEQYRPKKVFRKLSDEVLWDCIHAGTINDSKNHDTILRFPKEWEAQIYCTFNYYVDDLISLDIPVIGIKGDNTDVVFESEWEKWKTNRPDDIMLSFPEAGHLLPFEYPEKLGVWIHSKLMDDL